MIGHVAVAVKFDGRVLGNTEKKIVVQAIMAKEISQILIASLCGGKENV